MYTLRGLRAALHEPRRVPLEAWRLYNRLVRGRTGVRVMGEPWDTLVVLDGCRYDTFAELSELPGRLESRRSVGSHTSEFLKTNFTDHYRDTVYVSATPQLARHGLCERFHDCYRLWETHWDENAGTVLPESVTDVARSAHQEYPHKRLVVHYLQPHYPFIGPLGSELEHSRLANDPSRAHEAGPGMVWDRLREGELRTAPVQEAYRENLTIALRHVERLVSGLDGRTVITSDHGNVFGRWGVYGHPPKTYLDGLATVPWLTIEGTAREIRPEEAARNNPPEKDLQLVNDRLSALGYRD